MGDPNANVDHDDIGGMSIQEEDQVNSNLCVGVELIVMIVVFTWTWEFVIIFVKKIMNKMMERWCLSIM